MRTLPAFLFFALCAIVYPASGSEWSGTQADQLIGQDDNEYARAVQIHRSGVHGTLHALWGEDAPSVRELHYGRSEDEGLTWTSAVADRVIGFPDGNDLYEQCDVAESEQALIVVWSEEHDTGLREVHYGVSLDDGLTWSCQGADQLLSDPASLVNTGVPSITCDLDGVFHVVWHQTTPTGVSEVHYGRSTDDGATWSSATADRAISFPDGNAVITPKVMAYGDRLVVVWREVDAAGKPRIHAGFSADGGDTWSCEAADREVSPPVTLMADLDAAGDRWGGNGVYVVYKGTHDTASPYYYEVYVTGSTDGGETWTGESQEVCASYDEGAGYSASNPDVYVGPFSYPLVVWDEQENLSGTKEQHCSFALDPYTWTGAVADSVISFPDGENGYRPGVTGADWIAEGGAREAGPPRYWVAWTEFAGGTTDNYEVHLSIFYKGASGVGDEPDPPSPSGLARALRGVPNPSAATTQIAFTQAQAGPVRTEIFDAQGRLVRTLTGEFSAGPASLAWDGRDARGRTVQSGRYLARIHGGGETRTVSVVRF